MMFVQKVHVVLWTSVVVLALDNGLGRTPAMGWMSWERFRCNTDCEHDPDNCLSAKLLMQMADRMSEDGFLDAGYQYIAVDDCWMASTRNFTDGRLMGDPVRFPDGMKHLIDYIHSKGLKFGIYGDVGLTTCMGHPGNQYYVPLDADTYASWGVDMLKFDCCDTDLTKSPIGVDVMGFFLNKTGRPILYACEACANYPYTNYTHGANACNSVRVTIDVNDDWGDVYKIIDFYGVNKGGFRELARPGYFNDADELIVGDFGLSLDQQKAQMGMWALLTTPLFMSVDLRNIKDVSKQILLNKDVIAINQDPLGIQARRIFKNSAPNDGSVEGWLKPLVTKGHYALGILNQNNYGWLQYVNLTMTQLGLLDSNSYTMREVFTGTTYGPFKQNGRLILKMEPFSLFLAFVTPES